MVGIFSDFVTLILGWSSSWILSFLKFVFLFLILTIVIATVTLIERKVLSLTQRRVGPNYIGYKGRLQFIADALKLLVKHITTLSKVNRFRFLVFPALVCAVIYLFWANLIWGPNLNLIEIEYNLLVVGLMSSTYSILVTVAGLVTKNKYASYSSTRVILVGITLEVLIMFLMILLAIVSETLSFIFAWHFQTNFMCGFLFVLPALPAIISTFFIETGRIPFDFAEAESELIAGYTTEYGGFYFALFYLGEYFHLYCFSVVYAVCLFGG